MPRKFSNSDTIKNHNFLKHQSYHSGRKFIHPLVKRNSFVNFITLFSLSSFIAFLHKQVFQEKQFIFPSMYGLFIPPRYFQSQAIQAQRIRNIIANCKRLIRFPNFCRYTSYYSTTINRQRRTPKKRNKRRETIPIHANNSRLARVSRETINQPTIRRFVYDKSAVDNRQDTLTRQRILIRQINVETLAVPNAWRYIAAASSYVSDPNASRDCRHTLTSAYRD